MYNLFYKIVLHLPNYELAMFLWIWKGIIIKWYMYSKLLHYEVSFLVGVPCNITGCCFCWAVDLKWTKKLCVTGVWGGMGFFNFVVLVVKYEFWTVTTVGICSLLDPLTWQFVVMLLRRVFCFLGICQTDVLMRWLADYYMDIICSHLPQMLSVTVLAVLYLWPFCCTSIWKPRGDCYGVGATSVGLKVLWYLKHRKKDLIVIGFMTLCTVPQPVQCLAFQNFSTGLVSQGGPGNSQWRDCAFTQGQSMTPTSHWKLCHWCQLLDFFLWWPKERTWSQLLVCEFVSILMV